MRRISIWPETNHGPFGAMKTTESARSRKGTLCGDDTPTGSSTAVVENPFPEEGPRNLASTLIDLNSLQDITFKSVHVKSNISLNDRFIYLAKMFEHVKTELKAEAKLSSVEDVTLVPNPRNLSAFPLFRAFRSTYLSPVFPVILKEQWPTPKLKIIGSKLTPQAVEFRKFLEKKALKRFARRSARRGRDSRIIRSRWNQSASKGAETRKTKITTSKEDGGIDLGPSEKLSGSREAKEVRILKKECSSARRKEEPRDKTEAKCGSRKAIQINHREVTNTVL